MQNLFLELSRTLSEDPSYCAEDGSLLKNSIIEHALGLEPGLLKLLLANPELKAHFFREVGGTLVFDKVHFQRFVMNKQFLPDSYTSFKNKIGLLTNGGDYLADSQEVVLAWPYKDCVLEGGQTKEEAKRSEAFYNETLAPDQIDRLLEPKAFSNWARYTSQGETKVGELSNSENYLFKGNNLLCLSSILPVFRGRVKLIYIDPPFNTGNDSFGYNDKFNHSTWCTFIKNRLEIAKKLLRIDGSILIHCDDKELYYLKVIADEIFGRANFMTNIVIKTSDPSGHKTVNPSPYSQSEFLLLYACNKQSYKYKPQTVLSEYDVNYRHYILNFEEEYSSWKWCDIFDYVSNKAGFASYNDFEEEYGEKNALRQVSDFALSNKHRVFQLTSISDDAGKLIVAARNESSMRKNRVLKVERENASDVYITSGRQIYFYSNKVKLVDGIEGPTKPLTNIWTDIAYNGIAKEGLVSLKNGKKPEALLRRIIEFSTNQGDIVLDFFAGSGTTAAVALKMGRRFIACEQMDYINEITTTRLAEVVCGDKSGISKKVGWKGGGSFVYAELAQFNEAFAVKIQKAKSALELSEIYSEMQDRAFLSYKLTPRMIDSAAVAMGDLSLENQKRFLLEILDKNMLYVPFEEQEDTTYQLSSADKVLNESFYSQAKQR